MIPGSSGSPAENGLGGGVGRAVREPRARASGAGYLRGTEAGGADPPPGSGRSAPAQLHLWEWSSVTWAAESKIESEDPQRQRLLGIYYTPVELAALLVGWALRDGGRSVLDPSAGGCVFLKEADRLLAAGGVTDRGRWLQGYDIDPRALDHARLAGLPEDCVTTADFLAQDAPTSSKFGAVVGNPPYVRHHWLKGASRLAAHRSAAEAGVELPGTSSSWAYFVVHATRFLADRGRMALVLPTAAREARYSAPVRALLLRRFASVRWFTLHERVFDGTDEIAVVLLADGEGPGVEAHLDVATVDALGTALRGEPPSPPPTHASAVLKELLADERCSRLGMLARIRIGVVTGSNEFFVRSPADNLLPRLGDSHHRPIVSATRHVAGLRLRPGDMDELRRQGERVVLVHGAGPESPALSEWIASGVEAGVHETYKCRRRKPWYAVPHVSEIPDAFATCSRSLSPKLVANDCRALTTNALHGVFWNPNVVSSDVVVGAMSSVVALQAEMLARHYGGGVLKVEPSIWNALAVPVVRGAGDAIAEIDALARADEARARVAADELVLREGLGASQADVKALQGQVKHLAALRRP